ncbi:hypothetical protein JAAARDRAFT_38526 [Jaapia argillacea MUCL 33604]|uniref:C2H2-type domain-containing protein n=1 Tax=Jaapia argillacea MUCL 33604 TaxID=933084 RepID=A0A067PKH6_9AGAM|nr:hypothetical protein JAAARDRAFT_38526 [Jaapia argillacea MUCL 33604]
MDLQSFFSAPLGDVGTAGDFNNVNLGAMDDEDFSFLFIPPTPIPQYSNPGIFDDETLDSLIHWPEEEDNNRLPLDQSRGAEFVPITAEASKAPSILLVQGGTRPTSSMPVNIPIEGGLYPPIDVPITEADTLLSTIPPTIPKPYPSHPTTLQPSEIIDPCREQLRVAIPRHEPSLPDSLAISGGPYLGTPGSGFPSSNPSSSTSEGGSSLWNALQSVPTPHALHTSPSTSDHQLPRHRRTISNGGMHSASARAPIHGRSQSSGQLETPVKPILPRSPSEADLGRHSINPDFLMPQLFGADHREHRPGELVIGARRGRSSTSSRGRGGSLSRDASRGKYRSARRPSPYGQRGSSSSCSNTQLSPEAPSMYPHSPTSSFEGSPQSHWDDYADPPPSPSPSPSIPTSSYSPSPSVLCLEQACHLDDRGEGSSNQGNFKSHSIPMSASSQDGGQDTNVESDGGDFGPCKTTRAARRASEARRRGDHHFICKYCKEGFTRKESLESHYRSRKGIKEFLCNLCRKAFATGSDRNRHKKSVHKDINP